MGDWKQVVVPIAAVGVLIWLVGHKKISLGAVPVLHRRRRRRRR